MSVKNHTPAGKGNSSVMSSQVVDSNDKISDQTRNTAPAQPPIGGFTMAQAARMYHVSLRAVQRATKIIRNGIPALVVMCERSEIKLAVAEIISNLPHDEQREVVARGPASVRQLAALLRRESNSPQHRCASQVTDSVGKCPHCGGEL